MPSPWDHHGNPCTARHGVVSCVLSCPASMATANLPNSSSVDDNLQLAFLSFHLFASLSLSRLSFWKFVYSGRARFWPARLPVRYNTIAFKGTRTRRAVVRRIYLISIRATRVYNLHRAGLYHSFPRVCRPVDVREHIHVFEYPHILSLTLSSESTLQLIAIIFNSWIFIAEISQTCAFLSRIEFFKFFESLEMHTS